MPGFCKRSRDLLEPSRRAIVEAFIRSGQPLPNEAQHYIRTHRVTANGSGQGCIDYPWSADSPAGARAEEFEEEPSRDEATGLQALVAAADQVETCISGPASSAAQHQATRDTQTQQQLREGNEGPIAGQVAGLPPSEARLASGATHGQDAQSAWQMNGNRNPNEPAAAVANSQPPKNQPQRQPSAAGLLSPVYVTGWPGACSMITPRRTSASNHNFSTDATTSSDGVVVGEAQVTGAPETASAPRESGDQTIRPEWATYAEQVPSQQSLPQHTPLYGVQGGLAHPNLDHTSMITGQQILPCGNWPVADSHELHDSMAPDLLPRNDVSGIHHDTEGSGYSINDEWMRTVEEMFTQYGDVASYPS